MVKPTTVCCMFTGKSYIDDKLKDLQQAMEEGRDIAEEEGGKFLTHLLASKNLSMSQIYANVTELLLAGVDTVGSTTAHSRCSHKRQQCSMALTESLSN